MIYNVQNVLRDFEQFTFCIIKEHVSGVYNYYRGYNDLSRAMVALDDCGGGIMVEPKNIQVVNYIN